MWVRKNNIAITGLDLLCWLFCVILAFYLGPDINWDLMNYHLYAVDLQFGRGIDQDFMAASMQGYLNAVPYIPLYVMVKAGSSSSVILFVLATLHSANLMLVHRIFDVAYSGKDGWRLVGRFLSVALAGASSVFWLELGSSFADVIVSIPILIAVWQWLRFVEGQGKVGGYGSLRAPIVASLCLGVACGLKLTAAVWIFPIFLYFLLQNVVGVSRIRLVGLLILTILIGYSVVNGWWSFMLWREFGNPLFPFFNGVFNSPDAVQGVFQHQRFIPHGLLDAVLMPWRMVQLSRMVYLESFAWDIRPLIFFMLLICSSGVLIYRFVLRLSGARFDINSPSFALVGLICVQWCLWLASSGNGRYAVPVWILLGPAILILWFGMVRSWRMRLYGSLFILLVQYGANLNGGVERWGGAPYQKEFAHAAVPVDMKDAPHLFVSLQNQSLSFLSSQVHPRSAFVNLIGQIPMQRGGVGWGRVETILRRYGDRFWTLQTLSASASNVDLASFIGNNIRMQKALLMPYSMSINERGCKYFRMWGRAKTGSELLYDRVLACPGRYAKLGYGDIASWMPSLNAANDVFGEVERQCPWVHRGIGATTRYVGDAYLRQYVNTDITVSIVSSKVGLRARDFHGVVDVDKCLNISAFKRFQLEDDIWRRSKQYQSVLGSPVIGR